MTFRILALDGGGIRGAYTASVLTELETATNQRCVDHFDLIAGTSTGGLLALGLGLGIPAADLLSFYQIHGPTIFPMTGPVTRIGGLLRQLLVPKHDPQSLRTTLGEVLGDSKLGDAKTRLVIPAYDITEGRIFVFKTPHHPRFKYDTNIPVVDIALATSAAPTYFPAQLIRDHADVAYIDGGVWANAPALVGAVEAVSFLGAAPTDLRVLSIGTTSALPNFVDNKKSGALRWGTGLVNLLMTAQTQANVAMADLLSGGRVHRINAIVPDDWTSMDSPARIPELIALGSNDARKKDHFESVSTTFLNGQPVPEFVAV